MISDQAALVPLPEIDDNGRATFTHGGREFAVITHEGLVHVLDAACPHRGGPLVEGLLREGGLVCPWHWYVFDLATGNCRNANEKQLARYDIVDVDGVPHARIAPRVELTWAQRLRAHARGDDSFGQNPSAHEQE